MSQDHASRFRTLHERDGIFVMPNPWDVGTARILDALGFEALASASAALAVTLGRADGAGEVSRDEALAHGRLLADAVAVPINGDLETGFGDEPSDVAETVARAIEAGLAGCSIEDITGNPDQPLYDHGHAVARIRAGAEARDEAGSAFVLTARCEAYMTGHPEPLKICIERLGAMADAGGDVVYACGMYKRDDIVTLVREMTVPVNVIGGTGPQPLSVAELEGLGVKRVSLGPRLIQAALGGFLKAAEEVRTKGTFGFMSDGAKLGPVFGMVRRTGGSET
ncbi:MAG: isocitrate lyase/PEP mutase family protein [Alphaproteobacteria bacterium]